MYFQFSFFEKHECNNSGAVIVSVPEIFYVFCVIDPFFNLCFCNKPLKNIRFNRVD